MSNVNVDGLPPEMQARIAQIIEGAKVKAQQQMAAQQGPNPEYVAAPETPHQAAIAPPKAPNLMDHTIALRQEVAAMSEQVAAMGQVVEAVGQAVGQLYAMFQQQTTPTNQSSTYSSQFQDQVTEDDY